MIVLNSKMMLKSGGLYNLHADQNLAELKSMMKDLIIKEQPKNQAAMWANSSEPTKSSRSGSDRGFTRDKKQYLRKLKQVVGGYRR